MAKTRISVKIVLMLITLSGAAIGVDVSAQNRELLCKVAGDWFAVGLEQYQRGLYDSAMESLEQAQQYEQCFNEQQRKQLASILSSTRQAGFERQQVKEQIRAGQEAIERGDLLKAKRYLTEAQKAKNLSADQSQVIRSMIEKIDNKLSADRQQIAELYKKSMDNFDKGNFEAAQAGFDQISAMLEEFETSTGEGKLEIPAPKIVESSQVDEKPKFETHMEEVDQIEEPLEQLDQDVLSEFKPTMDLSEQQFDQKSDDQTKRNKVIESYSKALINAAISKVEIYIESKDKFRATESLLSAEKVLAQNANNLDKDTLEGYTVKMNELSDMISEL